MSRSRLVLAVLLVLAGVGCLAAGVALWSVPAALVVVGVFLLAAGLLAVDVRGRGVK